MFGLDRKLQPDAVPVPEEQGEGIIISPDTLRANRIPPGTRHRHGCLFGGNAAHCEWLRTESDEIAQNCSLFARSPPRGSFVDMRPFACDML